MSTIKFADNASSTLSASITNAATTAVLASGTGALFPTLGAGEVFKATFTDAATQLLREIVTITAIAGDTVTMVRGQEGTTALAWTTGDYFVNQVTAGTLDTFLQAGSTVVNTFNTRSGAVTLTSSDVTTALSANALANSKLAQMPAYTVKGNNAGSTANAADLSVTQLQTLLSVTSTLGSPLVFNVAGAIVQVANATTSGGGSIALTFPVTFPTACIGFVATANTTTNGFLITRGTLGAAGLTAYSWFANTSAASSVPFSYVAIGY